MACNRRAFMTAGAAMAAAFSGLPALAELPRTVRILVGFPAGTTPDVLSRKVGERMMGKEGVQSVVVENKLGAGGQLAVATLKTSPADGSSLLLTPMSMLGVFPHTYNRLPYDPLVDATPVSMGALFDYGIAVGPGVPDQVRTLNDLLAWFKANPAKASMGSSSTGSTLHFTVMMLSRSSKVDITHVGYKGSSFAIQEMLGGSLPALCAPLGSFLSQPGLRVLATTGAQRSRFTPNVPTLAEQGYKNMVFSEWYGFFLPGKASPETVKKFNLLLRQLLADKEIVDMLALSGMEAKSSSPEELALALRSDLERWGGIVKSIGFKADA